MASEASSQYDFIFTAEGLAPGAARVRSLDSREGLSTPYVVNASMQIDELLVEPRAWILRPAQLTAARIHDGVVLRRFGGVVTRVRERASRGTRQLVEVTLEPPIAALRLYTDHRIFQAQTTEQIVTTLLAEAGISAESFSFRLAESYPEREVCTQFGERTLDFISRLIEEDGIFYFFEQAEAGPIMVFGDSPAAYAATSPSDQLVFRRRSGLLSDEAILSLRECAQARPAKVTLRDHDFKRPALDLEAKAEADAPLSREHYDHPGRYADPGEGKRRAAAYRDAFTAGATGVQGESSAISLAPGHTFALLDAPSPELEKEWVVRDLEQRWRDDQGGARSFLNSFHLLPRTVPYRPPRRAPRAVVCGPQIAHVTGPAGEEIHCDEHGRVKLHFPWDRRAAWDQKSSAWVRVGQMHMSGSLAIPRVGWEVVVDFEDGDPDRPVVLGRLYSAKHLPPFSLPGNKAVSSLQSSSSPGGGGYNAIRMNDGGGGEQLHLHAEKDLNINVANNKTEKVATNATLGVGANHALTIGASRTSSVGASHELTVGASQTWAVGASRTKIIGGEEKLVVTGSRSTTIGASHTTMTPMSVSVSTPASFSETIGGSAIEAAALGVGAMVAGAASVTVGGAKIDAVAAGKSDFTVGAKASTVGGALISATGKDVGMNVGGAKATTVGGVFAANAGGDLQLVSGKNLNINVGGAVSMNAATIVLKVGGSTVTLSAGTVVIKSKQIKLTATGPQPELAPLVSDK
ncbi:type VI secretion system Vgr family protein [Sorangium cellulosum]|uniref:Uncharacterized protein n=1 Tax=Sorangium cellulosum So0157-2 TaxID=1254432 RepID=S4XTG7_SORCE|nr:type VI secretion system tip protein TssI/VgrG [Sorangium cellulosum]AGP36442.1 hypothetical protein SCE1572_19270 [Sorangium cellulosum So0157-2]